MYWTLKFFNSFIISLGFLFFFFFVKEISGSELKAILATFFLACIPCYLSHFIWAHALAVTLFFPAFYLILKTFDDKRYTTPAIVTIAAIFLTQPTQSIKFTIMLAILVLGSCKIRKCSFKIPIKIFLIAALLSTLWWAPKIYDYYNGKTKLTLRNGTAIVATSGKQLETTKKNLFSPKGGSATRKYHLFDYLYPPHFNMINNPVGVGIVLCALALFGLYYAVKESGKGDENSKLFYYTCLGWLIFTFLGMNSVTFNLPIGLFAFRFWMLFAIPLCMLAAETLFQTYENNSNIKIGRITTAIIIICVIYSSGFSKFRVNTSLWPYGVFWSSKKEMKGYIWLRKNLTPNSKVFAYTDNMFVIGHDMRADFWKKKYYQTYKNAIHFSPSRLKAALNLNGFEYIIISERDLKKFGNKVAKEKIKELDRSKLYKKIHEIEDAVWVFKLT